MIFIENAMLTNQESDPDETLKPVRFSFRDRDFILGLFTLDPQVEKRFELALSAGGGIVVKMNAYDLDDLLNTIAGDANHGGSKARERTLDALFDRVDRKMQSAFPGK